MGAKPQDPDFITDLRIKAEEGSAKAQYNLGVMYTEGEGVIKDYKQAYMYANISSYNGSKEAIKLRELIEKELTAEQINEAQELSREWIKSHK
ncbi:sel1 repeat family protein [Bathymodiolus platifrons methanotrophic gill symbiont]|uniref:sel1 repeat family protein n=1 Tax=Bathymodiolus platifrons methanotrophic gill symbiont TaxID=113268 RepID=UPI0011250EDB|nr:sel1 repeat family protein [Bathymodiolus platifrons methanotrophic gill symbiont]